MRQQYFDIKCKKCGGRKIQTTLERDIGYSNWTVKDFGYMEFKCWCGRFGSTKSKPANDIDNFEVICLECDSTNWDYEIGDVDGDIPNTRIFCKDCNNEWYEEIEDEKLKKLIG